jgi:hypothetical protein
VGQDGPEIKGEQGEPTVMGTVSQLHLCGGFCLVYLTSGCLGRGVNGEQQGEPQRGLKSGVLSRCQQPIADN